MQPIILGATYGDEATGFIGVAIAHTDYLGGAGRTNLQQRVERAGQRPAAEWFDDARLTQLDAVPIVVVGSIVNEGLMHGRLAKEHQATAQGRT